jgi:hypothetical protein
MRYALTCLLLLCVGCGGGNTAAPPLTTGPNTLASVQINASTNTIAVGQTTTITATGLDASGGTIAGSSATWQSSAPAIATVASGLVTGIAPGSAVITATVGSKSAQTTIVVVPAVSTSCSGVTPLSLAIGAPHTLTPSERATLCVGGGAAGSEYVLVPFKTDTIGARIQVSLTAIGTTATTGTPTADIEASAMRSSFGSASPVSLAVPATHGAFGAAFDNTLRNTERRVLMPLAAANSRSAMLRSMQRTSANRSAILNLPPTPTVGTVFHLNANGGDACTVAQTHTARVAAVSNNAIVAVDTLAPAGGFTSADYVNFAATFDTLIFALDTSAYGAPADLDGNGRVLIFFTQAVNQLTPASSTTGFIGGFFFSRDLFPTVQCATSNVGEMFYLPVVDPNKLYNRFFADKSALQIQLYGTLAHEFQHLINASRRMYVNTGAVANEEVWLNEGMSHIAEELLYFRESGLSPKSNITLATVRSSQAEIDAVNHYQIENLQRLSEYLAAPGTNSPYAQNDSLATRGATYQLLRYSLDESPGTNSSYLHSLVNSQTTGIVNFNAVFGGTFPDIFTAVQQQVLANFFGGSGIAIDPKYSFPSWDYRDVIGNGLLQHPANPLAMTTLAGTTASTSFTLTGGGVGYARFGIATNGTAAITSASAGSAVPADVIMTLIRTH